MLMLFRRSASLVLLFLFGGLGVLGQAADGKLHIHHIDVGQADAAVLISPNGQVVLFDMGEDLKRKTCQPALAYLDQLGIKQIDYIFVSHYHFDHIGCIPAVLKQFPLVTSAFDRGFDYPGATYKAYEVAIKGHEVDEENGIGQSVVLDKGSANPVTIRIVAVDGKARGGHVETKNENDLSMAVLVSFGAFREEIGGDLSGENTGMYQDVETQVAPDVGPIDVYKVHHHCSSYSSNDAWLSATRPTIGIISTGDGNDYGHPAEDCLTRLHEAGLQKLYWTEEGAGKDVKPDPGLDVIAGDIQIEVAVGSTFYTVTYNGSQPENYKIKGAPSDAAIAAMPAGTTPPVAPKFAWSKRSSFYHAIDCPDVKKILQENLVEGNTPPPDKTPSRCVKDAQ